ncbi:hypothetical protein [Methylobacterium planeticum]|uniref:Uncharacterized protein n=1 Tax=Methylobacterium planeticum TaxID=2615211 RepID=A0A6N6MP74_9HYPH|nr:hypothetical protein [Methylobacterium planeticum]KAB1071751.1 hypothetical protein F6X51_18240 [Methylobacterium planeticum]
MARGPSHAAIWTRDLHGLMGAAPGAVLPILAEGGWQMVDKAEMRAASAAGAADARAGHEKRDYVVWAFVALAASCTVVWAGLTGWIVWRMLAI